MKRRTLTTTVPKLLLTSAITAALAGCGGSSGGGSGGGINGVGDIEEGVITGNRDVNGDGRIDVSAGDIDGDGFEDFDIDGDGAFDTKLGDQNFDGFTDFDTNNDGERDFDISGDGEVDRSVLDDDGFLAGYSTDGNDDNGAEVDTNGDAIAPDLIEPSAEFPCGSAAGDDPDSSTNTWADNCVVTGNNQHRNSLYTAGIQRILWCTGFDDPAVGSVDAFTDGDWGPATQRALEAFQTDRGLTADGAVGPQTWQALRDSLTTDPLTFATGGGPEQYGVQGDRCATTPLFINQTSFENSQVVMGGWQLTTGENDATPIPFSIGSPFNVVD